jgi:thymidylate synthase (FAD)
MIIIKPSFEILSSIDGEKILKNIERAGRVCYQSEHKITEDSYIVFVKKIKERGHLAVIEHENLTVKFICDRGFSHELVRHRLASFCQESTRYCNYGAEKFGNNITVIQPYFINDAEIKLLQSEIQRDELIDKVSPSAYCWYVACEASEECYLRMLQDGLGPQDARSVLPNSLKTEIVITANLREWMHIFELRSSEKAHPAMRQLMIPLRDELRTLIPVIFE